MMVIFMLMKLTKINIINVFLYERLHSAELLVNLKPTHYA